MSREEDAKYVTITLIHTTYRTRDENNRKQRIELFLAPIHNQHVCIAEDADM